MPLRIWLHSSIHTTSLIYRQKDQTMRHFSRRQSPISRSGMVSTFILGAFAGTFWSCSSAPDSASQSGQTNEGILLTQSTTSPAGASEAEASQKTGDTIKTFLTSYADNNQRSQV